MATFQEPNKMTPSLQKDLFPRSTVRLNQHDFSELRCDTCKSTHIVETPQGFVCGSCGLVLEGKRIVFNRVAFSDIEHYARLGKTHIGTVRERFAHAHSVKLNHLQKLHSIDSNEKEVQIKAKIEISRIFSHLKLPKALEDSVYQKFLTIRAALSPGTRYRIPEKLVPLCIYFVCKMRSISINEAELLEVSHISKKEFNAFKLQIQYFLPHYKERDRQSYILTKLLELAEHFELGMAFYFQSKKILMKLWDSIKNTKDDVITGLVASILFLCAYQDKDKDQINVHLICKRLNIKMCTIQSQVKRRIFERFKVEGFTTLIKSTDLLKQVMDKLGLIDSELLEAKKEKKEGAETEREENLVERRKKEIEEEIDEDFEEIVQPESLIENQSPEIIEIKLGGARQTCNHLKDIGCYFFAFEEQEKFPVLVSLKSYDMSNFCTDAVVKGTLTPLKSDSNNNAPLFELEIIK
jgi:hypothetical protein